MADQTNEAYEKEIADLRSKVSTLEKENAGLKEANSELQEEKDGLEQTINVAKKSGLVSPTVPGKVSITLEDPSGKKVKKTVKFRQGRARVRLASGEAVSSAALVKLANGKGLKDETILKFPGLKGMTKQDAIDRITELFAIGSSVLEEAK